MKNLLFAFVAGSFLSLPGFAANFCPSILDSPKLSKKNSQSPLPPAPDFWNHSGPLFLAGSENTPKPVYITFSFDSEILIGEYWDYLLVNATPATLASARDRLDKIFRPVTKYAYMRALKYSEKQFELFGLRKGVDPNKTYFSITDLNSKAMSIYFQSVNWRENQMPLYSAYQLTLGPTLKSQNLPFSSHGDLGFPEITHESSESRPAQYYKDIESLHKIFPLASTQFHLGLPASVLSDEQVQQVAMAIEPRVILSLLVAGSAKSPPQKFLNTVFRSTSFISQTRGLLKVEFYAFTHPFQAHDLEIRQWTSLADGLKSTELAAKIAMKSAQGQWTSRPIPHELTAFNDERFGPVTLSLNYIADMLSQSQETQELGTKVKAMAEESMRSENLLRSRGYTTPMRDEFLEKLIHFLRENKVAESYDQALERASAL